MRELDRIEIAGSREFSDWFYGWQARWRAGARIRVLVARDHSHAIVVADPDAPRPRASTRAGQLTLF